MFFTFSTRTGLSVYDCVYVLFHFCWIQVQFLWMCMQLWLCVYAQKPLFSKLIFGNLFWVVNTSECNVMFLLTFHIHMGYSSCLWHQLPIFRTSEYPPLLSCRVVHFCRWILAHSCVCHAISMFTVLHLSKVLMGFSSLSRRIPGS